MELPTRVRKLGQVATFVTAEPLLTNRQLVEAPITSTRVVVDIENVALVFPAGTERVADKTCTGSLQGSMRNWVRHGGRGGV